MCAPGDLGRDRKVHQGFRNAVAGLVFYLCDLVLCLKRLIEVSTIGTSLRCVWRLSSLLLVERKIGGPTEYYTVNMIWSPRKKNK
jgi:hypothetical protein